MITGLAGTALWALALPASAQWYVSAEGGISQPIDQISKNSTIKTDAEYKIGPAISAAFGRRFDKGGYAVRLEAELSWRDNGADQLTVNTTPQDFSGDGTNAVTFSANALVELKNDSPLTPFLGAGLGIAFADQDFGYGQAQFSDHSTSIAWQLIGGVETRLNPRTSLFARARFVSAPALHFVRETSTGSTILNAEFDGFVFGLGARRQLGKLANSTKKTSPGAPGPWYLAAQIGFATQSNQTSEGAGQRVDTRFAPGAFGAVALGRMIALGQGRGRLELELSSRANDTKALAFNGFDLADFSANGAYDFVLMGNALFDLPEMSGVRPYAGGGIGIVHSAVYSRYSGIFIDGSDETFGYQLIGGASFALGSQLELFGEARYLHAANPDFVRVTSFGQADLRSQYRAWSFGAGFRYFFAKR